MVQTHHLLPEEKDFARMETELFGRLERRHARQVRRNRLVAAAAIVLLSAAGVAGVTQANQTAVAHSAYCFAAADTGSKVEQGQTIDSRAHRALDGSASSRAREVDQAIASCGLAWATGNLGKTTSIPPLQACIRNDQVVAVFPKRSVESADEFCNNLGMSAP